MDINNKKEKLIVGQQQQPNTRSQLDPSITEEKDEKTKNEIDEWLINTGRHQQVLTEWIGNNEYSSFEAIAALCENTNELSEEFDPTNENRGALTELILKLRKDHWNKVQSNGMCKILFVLEMMLK